MCPLLFNDQFIGTLSVYHTEPGFYRDDHRRLLDRVSEQAGAVIKNSMLFEQTQSDSLTDPLTGLPNTRYLFMQLTRELARAERLQSEISLMVMDLDSFKEINDNHGHHVGDRALCESRARAPHRRSGPTTSACATPATSSSSSLGLRRRRGRAEAGRAAAGHRRGVLRSAPGQARAHRRQHRHGGLPARRRRRTRSLLATADSRMYQNKADRKRRAREEDARRATLSAAPPVDRDVHRSATGII